MPVLCRQVIGCTQDARTGNSTSSNNRAAGRAQTSGMTE